MRFLAASSPLLALAALSSLTTIVLAKPYPAHIPELAARHHVAEDILQRAVCADPSLPKQCGYYGQLCCASNQGCGVNAANEAICVAGAGATAQATAGGWVYYTSTWVVTDAVTMTSVYSSYVGATAQATATAMTCVGAQSPCNNGCCDSGYYCGNPNGQYAADMCIYAGGGSSGVAATTVAPVAPLRPTSSGVVVITQTGTPTTTVPFNSAIATGVTATETPVATGGGGGLSSGAIAGIVIGVLAGLFLLFLLCIFCCARGLFHTIMACFGLGRKDKHTHEETYIEEHHHSAAGGGGRRWYGDRPGRAKTEKKHGGLGGALGMGALLGGAALALGLKRKHDKDERKSEYTGSSYYSDYTSTSSASSDDRRTRNTRHSSRR